MPITNQDFMEAAQRMIITGATEIDFRNSASRAYYAAYHSAKELISAKKKSINFSAGVHQQLIISLETSSESKIREVGKLLKTCKAVRAHADYELSKLFNKNRAQTAIRLAEELLKISNEIQTKT